MRNVSLTVLIKLFNFKFIISSNVDEYGFRRPDNFDYARYEEFMSSYLVVLANRSKKWFELLKDERRLKRGRKLRRYVEKGIPSAYRTRVSSCFLKKYILTCININNVMRKNFSASNFYLILVGMDEN